MKEIFPSTKSSYSGKSINSVLNQWVYGRHKWRFESIAISLSMKIDSSYLNQIEERKEC